MTDEKVILLKTGSFGDLVRLAASTIIPHQVMTYLIKFKHRDKVIIGLLGVFRDYYKYYGLPIFYYYSFDSNDPVAVDANYIVIYTGEDRYELSKNPKPGISIPIVTLAEKPAFIPDEIS
ncbi:MAG: hypothetical protein QXH02_00325 [Desulfurococcaceae archaeon]